MLRGLNLICAEITDASLEILATHFTSLRLVDVTACEEITLQGLKTLVHARPLLSIHRENFDDEDDASLIEIVGATPEPPTDIDINFGCAHEGMDDVPGLDDLKAHRLRWR